MVKRTFRFFISYILFLRTEKLKFLNIFKLNNSNLIMFMQNVVKFFTFNYFSFLNMFQGEKVLRNTFYFEVKQIPALEIEERLEM